MAFYDRARELHFVRNFYISTLSTANIYTYTPII